ncbi:hypothetical protein GOZ78_17480 [Agrobacterium vitis]|uniref:Suppressor of fused-like domain-containing protein n=1 Tax=Agrobacterium vitis TaxID=373 RepID=A0ABD6GG62_AGRVI|nr:suppressor of fused domain protein [Agrobacterium vitis]MUO79384.1 hypothetical protein [Agrobacterium vitis]MUO96209.1 hypothetical protein [Agrobacterium vitis]MUP05726.1 hypothetical protein [Agrobacterium vitis]MUZ82810.1 hypothetical protein [Agrobacterium vitis]MVA11814.1 hypothetical protein [Agrobacterium vitis]
MVESRSVPDHLERYLGAIDAGWSDETTPHGLKVVSFKNQPTDQITTYSTLGMSEFALALPGDRSIRQELVMSVHENSSAGDIANILLNCADYILERKRAVLRGEVINFRRPLVPGGTVTAAYATNPTPFEREFSELSCFEPPVLFVLLIPITERESDLIRQEGWSCYEDLLEKQDPDIWDLKRSEDVYIA